VVPAPVRTSIAARLGARERREHKEGRRHRRRAVHNRADRTLRKYTPDVTLVTVGDDRIPGNGKAKGRTYVCPVVGCNKSAYGETAPTCPKHFRKMVSKGR
jgi:hypothetical protein